MTTENPASTETPVQQTADSCSDCDLHAIEELLCTSQRFAKQAEVAAESTALMTAHQAEYSNARAGYQAARDAVQEDLGTIKRKLTDIIDDLECKLDEGVEDCVRESLDKVVVKIRECAGTPGCCVGSGEFTPPADGETASQLAGRIDEYRREMDSVEKCFTDLLAEAAAIPARVAELKAEVEAIAAELHADNPNKDLARLYARALIVRWKLRTGQLYKGYKTVNDFMDCLCRALQRALSGWEVIAVLEGRKAELDCQDRGKAAACAKRQSDMIDEVMCLVVDCCPPNEEEEVGDCGCGGHHDHHDHDHHDHDHHDHDHDEHQEPSPSAT
jgi:hypothetical protein